MRKLLAMIVVLWGCLALAGQAVAGATAGYSDCCLHGCKGMVHCANASCQACAAPQSAPAPDSPDMPAANSSHGHLPNVPLDAGVQQEPWTPPD